MKKPLVLTALILASVALTCSDAMAANQAGKITKPHAARAYSAHHVRHRTANACVDTAQLVYLLMTNQGLPACVRAVGRGHYDTRPEEYIGGPYDSPMSWD